MPLIANIYTTDNFPLFGTVSHGTMRPEDLIPAFCDALEELGDLHSATHVRRQWENGPLNDVDALDYLFDALDACAPAGYYFGAHPGDGSDYGFWEAEEC